MSLKYMSLGRLQERESRLKVELDAFREAQGSLPRQIKRLKKILSDHSKVSSGETSDRLKMLELMRKLQEAETRRENLPGEINVKEKELVEVQNERRELEAATEARKEKAATAEVRFNPCTSVEPTH